MGQSGLGNFRLGWTGGVDVNEIMMTHEIITVEICGPDGETKEKAQHVTTRPFKYEEDIFKSDVLKIPCSLKNEKGDSNDCG